MVIADSLGRLVAGYNNRLVTPEQSMRCVRDSSMEIPEWTHQTPYMSLPITHAYTLFKKLRLSLLQMKSPLALLKTPDSTCREGHFTDFPQSPHP